jgi:hypothetical protein
VGARQDADFRDDRADRRQVAAVDAAPVSRMFQRTILACSSLNTSPTCSAEPFRLLAFGRGEMRLDLGLGGVDGGVALLLVGDLVGGAQVLLASASSFSEIADVVGGVKSRGSLAAFSASLMIASITGWKPLVAEHDGAEHGLRQLLGFRFDHQHGVGGAGDDEVELRIQPSRRRRVEHVFAVDVADARAPIGPMKGTPERSARPRRRPSPGCRDRSPGRAESTVTTTCVSFL